MNDDAERIARRMMAIRQEMGEGVQEIVHGAQHIADWRYYVRTHPWVCVAGTVALGILAVPGKRRTRPDSGASASAVNGIVRAPASPPGLLGRAVQVTVPLVARSVATLVARRLAAPSNSRHDAADAESHD